jgi:hypothetical protein
MSGAGSRARRVEATRQARADAAQGIRREWADPRQQRIYDAAYKRAEAVAREVDAIWQAYTGETYADYLARPDRYRRTA